MKYAIASDHGGYELKENIKMYLKSRGIEVEDLGTNSDKSVSYATYGHALADFIKKNPDYKGIGICGTGLGISYALNRHKGIRAARVTSVEDAKLAKQHNDANVLALGGRQINITQAKNIIEAYEAIDYEGGRHQARIEGIDKK